MIKSSRGPAVGFEGWPGEGCLMLDEEGKDGERLV